jgi:hypothetical protein
MKQFDARQIPLGTTALHPYIYLKIGGGLRAVIEASLSGSAPLC